jgi:hypothetical protein
MNYPLATLTEQFIKERTFLKNVSPRTLTWYRIAFRNYEHSFPAGEQPTLPGKAVLQRFVIHMRERVSFVTISPY